MPERKITGLTLTLEYWDENEEYIYTYEIQKI